MNLLLDTHTFIWFITGSEQLGKTARRMIENPDNESFISMASIWEMAVKVNIGKLELGKPFEKVIDDVNENGFQILPINFSHLVKYVDLELHHSDPFDRLIVAQAMTDNMIIITGDKYIKKYGVKTLW